MDNQGNHQNTQPPQYAQQPPPQYPSQPSAGQTPGKGKAIASLVLGIIAIVLPIPVLNLAAGIVGLVLAILSKREGFVGGLRTAGFVCSLVGIVGGVVWAIIIIAGAVLFVSFAEIMFWQHVAPWW